MRLHRVKVRNPRKVESVYHCMSRAVNGELCLGTREEEVFRKTLHQVVDFSGVGNFDLLHHGESFSYFGAGLLQTVAAYIDLNPLRAGMVKDPKDCRYCGYGEAVAGNELAADGIRMVSGPFSVQTLDGALKAYRRV